MLAPISAQNRMPRDSAGSFAPAVAQMWAATRGRLGNVNREVCQVEALLASVTVVSLNGKSTSTTVNVRKCSNSHIFWISRNKLSQGIKLLPADWYSVVNSQSWNKPKFKDGPGAILISAFYQIFEVHITFSSHSDICEEPVYCGYMCKADSQQI